MKSHVGYRVLSNEMEQVLGYIEDNISGKNVAVVPTSEQLCNDAALEISISPLASLASSTTDQGVISHVADRANYTSEYKEEIDAQDDVGVRMATVSEK